MVSGSSAPRKGALLCSLTSYTFVPSLTSSRPLQEGLWVSNTIVFLTFNPPSLKYLFLVRRETAAEIWKGLSGNSFWTQMTRWSIRVLRSGFSIHLFFTWDKRKWRKDKTLERRLQMPLPHHHHSEHARHLDNAVELSKWSHCWCQEKQAYT